MWTNKEVDLAPHTDVGLVFQVRDTKFPHANVFENVDPFIRVSKQSLCVTGVVEDGGDKRLLVQLELACEIDGVALPDPV